MINFEPKYNNNLIISAILSPVNFFEAAIKHIIYIWQKVNPPNLISKLKLLDGKSSIAVVMHIAALMKALS